LQIAHRAHGTVRGGVTLAAEFPQAVEQVSRLKNPLASNPISRNAVFCVAALWTLLSC
jgi:hypothetical protein